MNIRKAFYSILFFSLIYICAGCLSRDGRSGERIRKGNARQVNTEVKKTFTLVHPDPQLSFIKLVPCSKIGHTGLKIQA
jgi:hypothetical protein